jgi:hypothetical protein
MKKSLLVVILVILFSCKKENKNVYIGDWYFDKIVDYDSSKTHLPEYIFKQAGEGISSFSILNDSVFENKDGFYYTIQNRVPSQGQRGYTFLRSDYYLGTTTKCKIQKSKISYFDKTEKKWKEIRIKEIKGDTMIVYGGKNVKFRLIRKHNAYLNREQFDAITLDRSPCFGSCPFNSTYIDRNGYFYFKGYDSNTQSGNLFAKLDKKQTEEIFDKFDKIDISKLKNEYFGGGTCGQTNTISFIKDGKIIKTIELYRAGPEDLIAAYTNLSFVYQQAKVDYDNQFIFGGGKVSFDFVQTQKTVYSLSESESFYIEVALRRGKKLKKNFEAKYLLDFYLWEDKADVKKIITDGRFYKIEMKDTTMIVDIGYNFIESNQMIKNRKKI